MVAPHAPMREAITAVTSSALPDFLPEATVHTCFNVLLSPFNLLRALLLICCSSPFRPRTFFPQYDLGTDICFIPITSTADMGNSVLKITVTASSENPQHTRRPALLGTNITDPMIMPYGLGSGINRFQEAVVLSVRASAAINLRIEVSSRLQF